ncbi:MAG: nucleotidyltransferase family protein [Anaerolineae bacterium]
MIHSALSPIARFTDILHGHLPELQAKYGVKSLALFGSYVRNEHGPDSDLDVLVELDDRGLTLLQFVGLQNHLSDLLGVKVDLVEKNCLKPTLAPTILAEAQPV